MLLTKKEEEALALLEQDIELEDLVNNEILSKFQSFKHFETQVSNLSNKYIQIKKELELFETRLKKTTIFKHNGEVKDDFYRCYNSVRLFRQYRGKSLKPIGSILTNS